MTDSYTRLLDQIETVLGRELPATFGTELADASFGPLSGKIPEAGMAALTGPARELLGRGGKRWRPLLMLLSAGLFDAEAAALPLVPLVEFAHTGSLILDDIEDASEKRRGGPAIHRLYGEDVAINAGCFLYFHPLSAIPRCGRTPEIQLGLYRLYAEHLSRLHLGQALDIAWHRDSDALPGEEDYLFMCRCKTGVLAGFAARAGAVTGGAPDRLVALLGEAFEDVGVAFQILDDVKNLSGGIVGKDRGDDIVEGKKSLPVILFLNRAPDKGPVLRDCFIRARKEGIRSSAVTEAIGLLTGSGAVRDAEKKARAMLDGARIRLSGGLPSTPARERLIGLIDLLG